MGRLSNLARIKKGFTIVELLVVIAVIGIIAGIVVVSYSGWKHTTLVAQIKSDLNGLASAMESARNFGTGYPATLPSTFTPSNGDTITLTSTSATAYCIDATTTLDSSIMYYLASESKDQGALSGNCATRPGLPAPAVPTGLIIVDSQSTTVTLSWNAASNASTYNLQCATDAGFIFGLISKTIASPTISTTISGLDPVSTYYCRVNANNNTSTSAWSASVSTDTTILNPPTGLALVSATISSINLTWNTNTDASSYTVECSTNSSFSSGVLSFSVSAPTITGQFNSLAFNTTYYCHIKTVTTTSSSTWSSTLTTATSNQYGSLATGTSTEGYWTSAPTGYFLEDGSAISRTQYAALFAVIGTTYGAGDGSTTFNLPDSRGSTVVNQLNSDAYFGTIGLSPGNKTDVQTIAELPSHSHTQNAHSHTFPTHPTGWEAGGYGMYGSGSFQNRVYVTGGTSLSAATAVNQSTGGSVAHNIIQPSIVKKFAIKFAAIDASARTVDVATSIHGYWASAPSGYLLEDGSAVSRTTYATLFAAIGTTYGAGDGSTTFNLPDSRGRVAVNLSSSDAEFNTMGEKYGEEAHTMTISEMPSHTHIQNSHYHTLYTYSSGTEAGGYGINGGGGFVDRVIVNDLGAGGDMTTSTDTATNQSTGSNASETVVQPSIVQKSAIKYTSASGSGNAVATGTSLSGYGPSAPSGYLVEDGSAVSRTTYATLFAAIGTTYGAGDGSTTFNLPDSRGRVAVNLSSSDAEFNTMGEKYGEKTHLMTIAEMASHTHIQNSDTPSIGMYPSGAEASGYGAVSGGTGYGNRLMVTGGSTATSSVAATNQSTGGGQPFNVIQPSIVKLFYIKY